MAIEEQREILYQQLSELEPKYLNKKIYNEPMYLLFPHLLYTNKEAYKEENVELRTQLLCVLTLFWSEIHKPTTT